MSNDTLPGLSVAHTYDPKLRKVTIRNAQFFPEELFAHTDAIEILDMSNGQLHELPENLGQLDRLRIAFFSNNPFGKVPKALAGCKNLEMVGLKSCEITTFEEDTLPNGLRGLILTDNQLTELPSSIGKLASLQKLMLAGNNLQTLPAEMAQCHKLQLLRLPANRLPEIPAWLWELPSLAWYSDASNPVSYKPKLRDAKTILWHELEMQDKLGESAKNAVYRARLKTSGKEVAVKLFGDGMTTDGNPDDEIQACILAGVHANLTSVIGKVADAPNNQRGLVMELVPPSFSVLGLPPDFTTLTRDVFASKLDLAVVIEVLRGVCSALKHLHQHGVMHGDVYAHNILSDSKGRACLGDLGASSMYDVTKDYGRRERLDVRGFGYLLDDLLAQVTTEHTQLGELRDACMSAGDKAVTRFDEIQRILHEL